MKNVNPPRQNSSRELPRRFSRLNQFICLITACFIIVCVQAALAQDSSVSYKNKTATIKIVDDELISLNKLGVEVYPTEIYWGDPIYIIYYNVNVLQDGALVKQSAREPLEKYPKTRITATSDASRDVAIIERNLDDRKHKSRAQFNSAFILEEPISNDVGFFYDNSPTVKLAIGGKTNFSGCYCEIPPLVEESNQFRKEIEKILDAKGAADLNIDYGYGSVGIFAPIRVSLRPQNDQKTVLALAEKRDVVQMIEIAGKQYHPAWFVRPGKNLLNESNVPTSLEGWRALEKSLSPSALRDEVQFIRMKIEVYAQQDDVEARNKIDALFNWLWTLPAAQRVAMFRAVPVCPEYETYPPPPRYVDLQREFYAVDDPKALANPQDSHDK